MRLSAATAPDDLPAELGTAIRVLRERREMTIEALAAEADIHWTYLSDIENRKRNPSWEVVTRLAAALEVGLTDLARLAAKQRG